MAERVHFPALDRADCSVWAKASLVYVAPDTTSKWMPWAARASWVRIGMACELIDSERGSVADWTGKEMPVILPDRTVIRTWISPYWYCTSVPVNCPVGGDDVEGTDVEEADEGAVAEDAGAVVVDGDEAEGEDGTPTWTDLTDPEDL
jgi:hypothetical protein